MLFGTVDHTGGAMIRSSMTKPERGILAVSAPGGLLTARQIQRDAQLGEWAARRAIGQLDSRGLIMAGPRQARWSITPRGVAATIGGGR
ncbi:hypothetical protein AB0H71_14075 [Nocardia sp. NPDC050697]|uniref:hypothetical protein n=1 Tax=Nocardia sp. NPDC050697 TaxID=3155158 RepID=UPI0033FC6050